MAVKIRKIAVISGVAVGAAVAFAPLAAADTDISPVFEAELSSLNSLFDTEAVLSGIPLTDVNTVGVYDFVFAGDASTTELTNLHHFLAGSDPVIQDLDPTSYDVFNGALNNFDDAFNVELYSLLNGGALDPDYGDMLGSSSDITNALSTGTVSEAVSTFLTEGWHELLNYFDFGAVTVY